VNGLRIAYVRRGQGPPLLLLHGFGEFVETWAYNLDGLSEHFKVFAVDLPGHGFSERDDEPHTVDYLAGFVLGFMDSLGIDRAGLVGRSMSAPVCLSIGVHHPNRASGIVLVSSGGYDQRVPLAYRLAGVPVLGELMLGPRLLVRERTVRMAIRRHFHDSARVPADWIKTATHYFRLPGRNSMIRHVVRSNSRVMGRSPLINVNELLAGQARPTLLIHGAQDRLMAVDHVRTAVSSVPMARLQVLEGCGHNPQVEMPARFNTAVISFLKNDAG
jgi:pimeloyl-ACP methyl ester carboxylesterase